MNNDKCEFCNGTRIEPGQADCKWCVNTGTKEGQKNALTESSNAEKMVSVRERLYEIANRDSAVSVTVRADDLRAFLAEQHQGEPVALPARKPIPDQATFIGGNAYYTKCFDEARSWNACLDEIAKLGPLYTRADAGEVERLRLELREQHEIFGMQEDKIDALRAQLAERDALLRDIASDDLPGNVHPNYRQRAICLLSVSAEPEVKP